MEKIRILHLSDIHIGNTYMESKNIAYRIISDIENESLNNIQCVVVTGDIFEGKVGYTEELITEAVDFFNIIQEQLFQFSKIQKNDFLFVPGNHDIIRSKNKKEYWKKYTSFLKQFYGEIPCFYDKKDFSLLKIYNEYNIAIVGFNSVGLEEISLMDEQIKKLMDISEDELCNYNINRKELLELINIKFGKKIFVDYGEISPEQILNLNRKLKKYDDLNIVAMLHHHFYLFPEIHKKYGDSSLIRNYTNVIQQLQQMGVKTVLHGHKHFDLERPLITESYYDNASNIINIIAGGSIGTNIIFKHTFNIIDFFNKENNSKIILYKFTYNEDHLEPIQIKRIPPESIENNNTIKLLNILEFNSPELYNAYLSAIEKINIATDDYNNIIKWFENTFKGFDKIQKILKNDLQCIFILLYTMNYRVLSMRKIIGKQQIDDSYFEVLDNLYSEKFFDSNINKKSYFEMLKCDNLSELKEIGDNILNSLQDKKSKYHLSFAMFSIFITDMYLMFRYYAGSFYQKHIKYKVNIQLNENEFHQNIPVNKIMIYSDADRRSAVLNLKCNSATSHKMAVLFVKEFELIISKYEDYFKIIGLKLYYIIPKIEKNEKTNTVDNYNFEAFIPTLIPLLTGDNIYSKKEVFARELIQNSIDAIAVRSSKDIKRGTFDKNIYINFGEKNNIKYFKIKDFGTGMDRFKIERYFTSIGRSFYSGDEYRDLEITYKPISNFGIGFLSAFMVCREIDVKTKYYIEEKEGLKLHIPNYDGCFFIEKDRNIDVGTEITLYIDKIISKDITFDSIIDYIKETIRDIKYNICIKDEINNKLLTIEAHKAKSIEDTKSILFVPFLETMNIEKLNVKNDIWTNNFKTKYPYGLLIFLGNKDNIRDGVLNSGIKLSDTNPGNIWQMLISNIDEIYYPQNMFLFNFPSNYIDIDVAREKINSFSKDIMKFEFTEKLINEIVSQIQQYFDLSKENDLTIPASNMNILMMYLARLCSETDNYKNINKKIMSERYVLYIRFELDNIDLIVSHSSNKILNAVLFTNNNIKKIEEMLISFTNKNNININNFDNEKIMKKFYFKIRELNHVEYFDLMYHNKLDELFYYKYQQNKLSFRKIETRLLKIFNINKINWCYSLLLLLHVFQKDENERSYINIINIILYSLLERYNISNVEREEAILTINKKDIEYAIKVMETKN